MTFTVQNDSAIDAKIQADLDIIRGGILGRFSGIKALVLTGGFGRGEGGVLQEQGSVKPVNDYDIVIFGDVPLNGDLLKSSAQELAVRLGIWHVDLISVNVQDVNHLPFTMFNSDTKYGGCVFWGDPYILDRFPAMNPLEMPIEEGRVLLFNRIIALLESFSLSYLDLHPRDHASFFLFNQTTKAILATCDAILVQHRAYHHSYREKRARFLRLSRPSWENELVHQATQFKLMPTFDVPCDPIEYWFAGKEMFAAVMLKFMAQMLGAEFHTMTDLTEHYWNYRQKRLRLLLLKANLRRLLRRGDSFAAMVRQDNTLLDLQLTGALLLSALQHQGVDEEIFGAARRRWSACNGLSGPDSWEQLRQLIVKQMHVLYGVETSS